MSINLLAGLVGIAMLLAGIVIAYIFLKVFSRYRGKVANAMDGPSNSENPNNRWEE